MGEDGFGGLLANLPDDAVIYGAFLARSGKQQKRVFCHWVGEGVKPLERARVSMHLNDVMRGFEPVCSFDIPTGETTEALCEAARASIHRQLSSFLGDGGAAAVLLDSNSEAVGPDNTIAGPDGRGCELGRRRHEEPHSHTPVDDVKFDTLE